MTETKRPGRTRRAGQIQNRGPNCWLVRVFTGRGENGRRLYQSKTVHGTKDEAERVLHELLYQKDLGTLVRSSRETLNSYLDRWLEVAAKGRVRPRTLSEYGKLLSRYVRPAIGAKRLQQVGPLDIQGLYKDMGQRGLSARTVRLTHAVLRNALQQAAKWRLLPQNPADLVDLPHQERREMRALSGQEATRFLAAAKDDRFYALFLLAMTTGMRPGEYMGLQWRDTDLEAGTVRVCRTVERTSGAWRFAEPKTARSRRLITLNRTLTQALRAHKKRQLEERLTQGTAYAPHGLVFPGDDGQPLSPRTLIRHFKETLKTAGLPTSIRLYDLRHTCATLLLECGQNPKVVSERLGHASIALTLDTYSHVLPGMQEEAATRLEEMLCGARRKRRRGWHTAGTQGHLIEEGL